MRFLVLFLAACSAAPVLPPGAAQGVDEACQRALADLRADRDAGVACEAAKARAAAAEPLCPLKFHCPSDGGDDVE